MNKKNLKVGVIGLGPVGMILAVHLQEAGCDVAICDNDKIKMNLIRQEGVRLEGVIEKHCFFKQVFTDISELQEFNPDILIFALKSYHMPQAIDAAATFKKDNLYVVSAQNGLDVEQLLSDVFGESRTLRMVINFAGNLNTPSTAKVTFFNPPNYIASIDDSSQDTTEMFVGWLNKVDLKTEVVSSFEILKRVWVKTILNASLSPLCGIGKLTMKEAMEIPDTVEIIEQIIIEAIEVAETEKIKFEDDFIRRCLRYLRKAGSHFPSLAVDLINNRPTEIDYFNGKIVEYGRKHYIRTPLNLAFTNMVKAITHKNLLNILPDAAAQSFKENLKGGKRGGRDAKEAYLKSGNHFLGIDLGSAYTKFTVIDENETVAYQTQIKTLNRDRVALKHVIEAIKTDFNIRHSCATGYGRKHFSDAEIIKTEINCAALGSSKEFSGAKTIIDIGGEDIKVIHCSEQDNVDSFYLNDKCAAGTGAFITEIAERTELEISEMSNLAAKSNFSRELNSFCTVFAKTEIMGWLFEGISKEDIARGVYISIANRVSKLRVATENPIFLAGGVAAYHPFLRTLLEKQFNQKVFILENPVYTVSFGAALIAKKYYKQKASPKNVREIKKAEPAG